MGASRDISERRALIALVAVFALLVQTLWPAAVQAAPDFGGMAAICTGHGLGAAPDGAPAPADDPAGQACQHCVCPVVAAVPPAVAAMTAEIIRYAEAAPTLARRAGDPVPGRGLAAPPPPGRGPPHRLT